MKYDALRKKLLQLEIEEIKQFRDDHPANHTLTVLCNGVITEKAEDKKVADLERELDEIIAKKNAPDGAATPSQGNETR